MDFLFLLFFFGLSAFFIVTGSWRKSALVGFVGIVFLILSAFFVLSTGIEVVNGTNTTFSSYSVLTNDTGDGFNTTITGSKIIANTYARLPRDWEMTVVTILSLVSVYLLFATFLGWKMSKNEY